MQHPSPPHCSFRCGLQVLQRRPLHNSRYAKVGDIPKAELNHLELQFLLLNGFCLRIHSDEMQGYADVAAELLLYNEPRITDTIDTSVTLV
ncbi:hypothetical protein B0H13DRAFT_2388715 [Mycena leptocephala]|nr:hypothetical protein B0H13DRAFT_2388715 [Mycena leptocephala]